MGFTELMKKLFDPRYADKKVEEIRNKSQNILKDSAVTVDKFNKEIISKRDVSLTLFIATGGREK